MEGPGRQSILVDGDQVHGISVCNVPVGSEAFVKAYLKQKGRKVRKGLARVSELLDPARWPHSEIPSKQMLWMLLSLCLQFTGDYWLRYMQLD